MRFYHLALFVVLATSLVSAKDAANKESAMAFKPTEAPLMMSTARPTAPPKINKPTPTKSMNFNVPPKVKNANVAKEAEKPPMPEAAPLPAPVVMEDKDPMLAMESNDAPPVMLKSQEIQSHKMKVGDVRPVQVTGFITRNGNIYEIEGKDGIGLIEGRQSTDAEKKTSVCNYGTVVIYSDVPCDQVTNIKVGEIEQHYDAAKPSASEQTQANGDNSPQKPQQDYDDLEDFNENAARRRKQQNRNRKRNGNGKRRRNGIQRPAQNGNRRRQGNRVQKPVKTQQQRRQQQKKRQQMQRQQQKRRQQQQRQRQQNKNRQWNRPNQAQNQQQKRRKVAQWQQEDDYEYDDQDDYEYEN